jgi:hypothetical protein
MLIPKNHSTITCKKGAKILPTFSCIVFNGISSAAPFLIQINIKPLVFVLFFIIRIKIILRSHSFEIQIRKSVRRASLSFGTHSHGNF